MSILINGDCLEEFKDIDDDSVDLIFCDLPYGQTSCKWDCCIDLNKFWIEVMRVKKLHTPIFMTTTTKFGVSLINSAPKKCPFRYDIVWVKYHSTEKPVALMEWVLKYYSKEGDVVLDPTMGSGSTGIACKNMNRNFIGIEKDPEIYEVAVNRIED